MASPRRSRLPCTGGSDPELVAPANAGAARDVSSLRGISAARYDLIAREGGTERARAALDRAGLLPADAG